MFLTLTGAVFLIYAVILCIISNYNLGIFLNIILGGCILFSGIFFDEIVFFCSVGSGSIIAWVIISGFILELFLVIFLAVYGRRDNLELFKRKCCRS